MRIKRRISFFLQKVYCGNNKESQIRMRVRWSGNVCQFNVGFNIHPEKWDKEGNRCKRNITNESGVTAIEINREISIMENAADDIFKQYELYEKEPTQREFKNDFNEAMGRKEEAVEKNNPSVQMIFSQYIIYMSEKKSWENSTIMKHNCIRNLLKEFNPILTIEQITVDTLTSYHKFLLTKMQNSSIIKHFGFLRSFFKWCTDKGLLNEEWKKFKPEIKTIHRKQVIFLTWEELIKLYNFQFLKSKQYLERVRDVFCFQCFTSLRFSDVYQLRRENVYSDHIRVCTEKTDTELRIELNKFSRAILDKYRDEEFHNNKALPVPSNQKSNQYIKECCYLAGIDTPVTTVYYKGSERIEEVHPKYELISTHTGRRTFICNALRLGISPEIVMKWTGHSNYSQMQPYIDVANKDKEIAMKLFNID